MFTLRASKRGSGRMQYMLYFVPRSQGKFPPAPLNRTSYWIDQCRRSFIRPCKFPPKKSDLLLSVSSNNCQKRPLIALFKFAVCIWATYWSNLDAKKLCRSRDQSVGFFHFGKEWNAPVEKISQLLLQFHLFRCVAITSEVMHNVSIKHTIRSDWADTH